MEILEGDHSEQEFYFQNLSECEVRWENLVDLCYGLNYNVIVLVW